MAKTGSYIKLDRGLKNNAIWLEKPFSKGQAWVDLLILAQGMDAEMLYRGKVQTLIHGNVYTSLYFLANRWGWSRSKVYRFLEELLYAEMIEIKGWTTDDTKSDTINRNKNKTKSGTVITIVNWAFYQHIETIDDTNNDTTNRKTNSKKTRHTIERYNRKKEKDKENIPPKSPKGGLSPSVVPERGTNEFRVRSHLLLDRDEGTLEDIPEMYNGMFDSFQAYYDWRNQ